MRIVNCVRKCVRKMSSKKRVLTLKQKIEIIEFQNKQKLGVRALAIKFQIGKTQAADIIKNKDKLLDLWHSNKSTNSVKRIFKSEGFNIDAACYEWFTKARNKNIPLTGTLIREKAKEIAGKLGNVDFKASSGWLERFKKRHNIAFKTISGEGASVNPEDVSSFLSKLPSLIENYRPCDIYNADETGLFYRALPDKTLALKGEKCTGGKMAKERLTILHCANMAGGKEKLVVIGKAARPRAFKNIDLRKLPVTWCHNRKSWMTSDLMTSFLVEFDNRMRNQKRNILLFLDNAASHPREIKLTNIKLIFLPPNTTAYCQPLDQGIIKNFKFWYRSFICKHLISEIDSVTSLADLVKSINLLDVIYFIDKAWKNVTSQTIKNCFKKAGFTIPNSVPDTLELPNEFESEDDIPLSVLQDMIKAVKEMNADVDVAEYIDVDSNLIDNDETLDIVGEAEQCEPLGGPTIEDVEVSSDEEPDEHPIKTFREAKNAIKNLKNFCLNKNILQGYEQCKNLEIFLDNEAFKKKQESSHQTKISDYFHN